jgi:beta-lactam-binding protein with PASTA domain
VIGDFKNHLEYSRFPDESTSLSNAYYPDGQRTQMQETNIDKQVVEGSNEYPAGGTNYYSGQQYRYEPSNQQYQQQQQNVQQGYQTQYQQGYQPQQQRQQPSYSSANAQRPESSRGDTNPFRAQGAGGGTETGDRNPFRQGY